MNDPNTRELNDIYREIDRVKADRAAIVLDASSQGAQSQRAIDNQRRAATLTLELVRLSERLNDLKARSSSSGTGSGTSTPIPVFVPGVAATGDAELRAQLEQRQRALRESQDTVTRHVTRIANLERELEGLRLAVAGGATKDIEINQLRNTVQQLERRLTSGGAGGGANDAALQAEIAALRQQVRTEAAEVLAQRREVENLGRQLVEAGRLRTSTASNFSDDLVRMQADSAKRAADYEARIAAMAAQLGANEQQNQARLNAAATQVAAEHQRLATAARDAQLTAERNALAAETAARAQRERTETDMAVRRADAARVEQTARDAARALVAEQSRGDADSRMRLGEAARENREAERNVAASTQQVQRDASALAAAQSAADQARGAATAVAAAAAVATADATRTEQILVGAVEAQNTSNGFISGLLSYVPFYNGRGTSGNTADLSTLALPPPLILPADASVENPLALSVIVPVQSGKALRIRLSAPPAAEGGARSGRAPSFTWFATQGAGTEQNSAKSLAQILLWGDKSRDLNNLANKPIYTAEKNGIFYDAPTESIMFYTSGQAMVSVVEMILKPVLSYWYDAQYATREGDADVFGKTVVPLLFLVLHALDEERASARVRNPQVEAAWEFMREVTQWLFIKAATKAELARDDRDAYREQTDGARNTAIGNSLLFDKLGSGIGAFTAANEADKNGRRNTLRGRQPAAGKNSGTAITPPPLINALRDESVLVAKTDEQQLLLVAAMQANDERVDAVFAQNAQLNVPAARRASARAASQRYRKQPMSLEIATLPFYFGPLFGGNDPVQYAPAGTHNERVLLLVLFQHFYPTTPLIQMQTSFITSPSAVLKNLFATLFTTPTTRGTVQFTTLPDAAASSTDLEVIARALGVRGDLQNKQLALELQAPMFDAATGQTRLVQRPELALPYFAAELGIIVRARGVSMPILKELTVVTAYALLVPYTLNSSDIAAGARYIDRFGLRPQFQLPVNASAETKEQFTVKSAANPRLADATSRDLVLYAAQNRLTGESLDAALLRLEREGLVAYPRDLDTRRRLAFNEMVFDDGARERLLAANMQPGESPTDTRVRLAREGRWVPDYTDAERTRLLNENRVMGEPIDQTRLRMIRDGRLTLGMRDAELRQRIEGARLPNETFEDTRRRLVREGILPLETEDETFRRLLIEGRLYGGGEQRDIGYLPGDYVPGALTVMTGARARQVGESDEQYRERLVREGEIRQQTPEEQRLRLIGRGPLPNESYYQWRLRMVGLGLLPGETEAELRQLPAGAGRLIGQPPETDRARRLFEMTQQPGETPAQFSSRMQWQSMMPGQSEDELRRQLLYSRARPAFETADEARRRMIEENRLTGELPEVTRARLIREGRLTLESPEETRMRLAREGAMLGEDAATIRRRLDHETLLAPETLYGTRRLLVQKGLLPDETPEESRLRLISQGALPMELTDEQLIRMGRETRLPGESDEAAYRRAAQQRLLANEGLLPGESIDDARRRIIRENLRPGETQEEMRERLRREGATVGEGLLPGETVFDARMRMKRMNLLTDASTDDAMLLSTSIFDRLRVLPSVVKSDKRHGVLTGWLDAANKKIGVGDKAELTTLKAIEKSTDEKLTVFIPDNFLWYYIRDKVARSGGKYGSLARVASFFVVRGVVDIGSKSFNPNVFQQYQTINGVDDISIMKLDEHTVQINESSPLRLVPYGVSTFSRRTQYESDLTRNGRYYVLEPFKNMPVEPPLPAAGVSETESEAGRGRKNAKRDAKGEFESTEHRGKKGKYVSGEHRGKNGKYTSGEKRGSHGQFIRSSHQISLLEGDGSNMRALEIVLHNNGLDRALFAAPSGSYTVFAPTAAVWRQMMEYLDSLPAETRRNLLKYHVVVGDLPATVVQRAFVDGARRRTLDDGLELQFTDNERVESAGNLAGRIFPGDLVTTDQFVQNKRGDRSRLRVHFINRLLAPTPAFIDDVFTQQRKMPQHGPPGTVKPRVKYSRMHHGGRNEEDDRAIDGVYEMLQKSKLTIALFGGGSSRFTILVPTPEAFDAVQEMLASAGDADVAALLRFHVLKGDVDGQTIESLFMNSETVTTLSGDDLTFVPDSESSGLDSETGRDERGLIYSDEFVAKDLEMVDTNGNGNRLRVHVIARVLMPLNDDDDGNGGEEGEEEEDDDGGSDEDDSPEEENDDREMSDAKHKMSMGKNKQNKKPVAPTTTIPQASTASKPSLTTPTVDKLSDASAQHKTLLAELKAAPTSEKAVEAVQKFATVVSKAPRKATASDKRTLANIVQSARDALALNLALDPVQKRDAHGEITRLQN